MCGRVERTDRQRVPLTRRAPLVLGIVIAMAIVAGRTTAVAGPATCTGENQTVKRLEAQLKQHVQAVRNLRRPTTAQTAEQWLDITEQDREGARRYFFDGVQGASFAAAEGAAQSL